MLWAFSMSAAATAAAASMHPSSVGQTVRRVKISEQAASSQCKRLGKTHVLSN